MFRRTALLFIVVILVICTVSETEAKKKGKRKTRFGPKGMGLNYSTTCSTFSKNARFNPYSVLNERWFVFFYWASPSPVKIYTFAVPSANHTVFLHKMFDGKVTLPVDWSARQVLMQDQHNTTSLLVERGDRGQYWQYILLRVKKDLIEPRDVRLKQTGDGRLLGFMDCKTETVYVMSRINEVPPKERLQEEAARLGYRGRRGKSYLYQGHEWMPIPEADENLYWARPSLPDVKNEEEPMDNNEQTNQQEKEVKQSESFNSNNELKDLNSLTDPKTPQLPSDNIPTEPQPNKDSKDHQLTKNFIEHQYSNELKEIQSGHDLKESQAENINNDGQSFIGPKNRDATNESPQVTDEPTTLRLTTKAVNHNQINEPEFTKNQPDGLQSTDSSIINVPVKQQLTDPEEKTPKTAVLISNNAQIRNESLNSTANDVDWLYLPKESDANAGNSPSLNIQTQEPENTNVSA